MLSIICGSYLLKEMSNRLFLLNKGTKLSMVLTPKHSAAKGIFMIAIDWTVKQVETDGHLVTF